ncbi:MAG TPA: TetR/AcrR family transcriptional regulator [Lysobacter sp.]|nr:TetR/AcrR family transcriptional regulator [Lysobacter sp.]
MASLRKRGEERVDRFLEAATQVFLEKGYRHARLSEIVSRAGGSLATLYRVFGNKEGLAHAIIERQAEKFTLVFHDPSLSTLPPEEGLHLLARRFVEAMVSVESQVLHRTIIGEGHSFPELRDWYFEHAVGVTNHILAEYLLQQQSAGRLVLPQGPELAAIQLAMLMVGDLVLRMSSGHLVTPDPVAAADAARAGVDAFLQGALPR